MIVDCHTHLQSSDGLTMPSEHLAASEMVDKCIVLCDNTENSQGSNERLAEYTTSYSTKMIGFGTVRPTEDKVSVKSINSNIVKLGLKGIVLYCAEEPFHPAHSRAMRLYESAQELQLPVFFHNAKRLTSDMVLDYAQPYMLDEVARTFKNLKIIIGSMGVPFTPQTIAMIGKHENVYADLTIDTKNIWEIYNMVVSAYEQGVMNKLLFGSGFPIGNASRCIETLLGFNKLLGDTALPTVPLSNIRNIIERDTLAILGIDKK